MPKPSFAPRHARTLAVTVPCPLCGARSGERVYRREVETHSALGRTEVCLELCGACGFLFTNPRPRRAQLREHYQSLAASGNTFHETGAGSRAERFLAYRAGFVRRALAPDAGPGRLLDVGCSTGDLLLAIDLPGWTRIGLEPSRAAARVAHERGLTIAPFALEDSPLEDGVFDVVTCISCLEHALDPHEFLALLTQHVAPGGLLVLSVPDSSAPVPQVSEFFGFEHLSHWTRATLLRLLREHGYQPVLVETSEGPALNIAARHVGRAAASAAPVENDALATRAAVAAYARGRAQLEDELRGALGRRVEAWRARGARVALYGAGVHSRFLLDLVDLSPCLAAVIDSDPAKHGSPFLRWTVQPPEALPDLGLDAVVVSSRPFQREMAARIGPLAARAGVEVVTLYHDEAAAA
jgi:SAM-dependent methyltransferase